MAKQSGIMILGIGALVLGGLYLMAKSQNAGTGGAPGIRVEGDCGRIVIESEQAFARASFEWAAAHSEQLAAMEGDEAVVRLWTYLAGCEPRADTVIASPTGVAIRWDDYLAEVRAQVLQVGGLYREGASRDGEDPAAGLVEAALTPLRPTLAVPAFPIPQPPNGGGGPGPFTPGGA